LRPL